jgi:hypothetical protein
MKKKNKVTLIVGFVGTIIAALISAFFSSKPELKSNTILPQKIQVQTNHGRITSITAEKVNYSEKDMTINNGKTSN